MEARLGWSRGRPELRVDGTRVPAHFYVASDPDPAQLAAFRDLGVGVVGFPATCDFHLYGLAPPCWLAEGVYDYDPLDRRLDAILDAHPEALLLPRVYTSSPPWWDDAHPEDLVVWEDGGTRRPLHHGAAKDRVASLGSDRWQDAMAENLTRFVEHLENGPHAEHVLGALVTSGTTEEWFHHGTLEGALFDYNEQVSSRFRTWLKGRYGDAAALSRAWGREVDLDRVAVPDPARRRARGDFQFRHPVEHRDVLDFGLFFADLTAETVIGLARVLKQATGGKKLFGCFFGYLLGLTDHPAGVQNSGHLGLHRLLDEDAVDFIASPAAYAHRRPGDGFSLAMVPAGSLALHGQVFFRENDLRTHVDPTASAFKQTETARETVGVQLREFACALTRGQGQWWFDMTGGWYDDPVIRETLATILAVDARAAGHERRPVAEIALVVDDESALLREGVPYRSSLLLPEQAHELSRVGAPFDVILARDLPRAPDYKLVVIPDLFDGAGDTARVVGSWLDGRATTVLWIGAPGFVGARDIAPGHAEALCGFRLAIPPTPHLAVVVGDVDGERVHYGSPLWYETTPVVDDDRAQVLGTYQDTDRPGLARRRLGATTSIYSGAPAVAGRWLRRFARDAGVHLYGPEGDAVDACSRFVAVHARVSGVKELTVPGVEALFDVVHGVEIPAPSGRVPVRLTRGDTAILFRGSRDDYEMRS